MKYILFILLVFSFACSDKEHSPIGEMNGDVPPQVSNVTVVNTSGGAILTYDLPVNNNIQYVKAKFVSSNNKEREVIVSSYVNSLEIKGIGNTDAREVRIYSVSKFGVSSEVFVATIKPLTPPIQLVRQTLSESVDFGGFILDYTNEAKADVSINVLVKDEQNKLTDYDALYTSQAKGKYAVRGLPNKENEFGVYVMDRWENVSDTLYFKLTPWKEELLNKTMFSHVTLAGDENWDFYNGAAIQAYDDIVNQWNYAVTEFPKPFPHRLTIDLGVDVKLSRMKIWQRPGDDVLYQHAAIKRFRMYGKASIGSETQDDPLNGWIFLMECESLKPSGLPLGQNSAEDVEFAAKGEEFSFPRNVVPVIRYIRLESLEAWSDMQGSQISELSFWGSSEN